MKKINANFNSESFFRKILQENLILADLNLNETDEILKKLNIKNNDEIKEFTFSVLSQKIEKLEAENLKFKTELEKSRAHEKSFNKKIKEMNDKILNLKAIMDLSQGKFIPKEGDEIKAPEKPKKRDFFNNYKFCPLNKYNNLNFMLSNKNKTIEKTSIGWQKVCCNNSGRFSEKFMFSIKIKKTANGFIKLGYCVKNAYDSSLYKMSSCFTLCLFNGTFINRSNESSIINALNVKENQIASCKFDVKEKTIEFFLDGASLAVPEIIDLSEKEIFLLFPCVDLRDPGDKLSIIKFEI